MMFREFSAIGLMCSADRPLSDRKPNPMKKEISLSPADSLARPSTVWKITPNRLNNSTITSDHSSLSPLTFPRTSTVVHTPALLHLLHTGGKKKSFFPRRLIIHP